MAFKPRVNKNKDDVLLLGVCFFVLLLISAVISFRPASLPGDTSSYIRYFEQTMADEKTRISEPFFWALTKFSTLFSENHYFFFFLVSCISSFSLFCFLIKISKFNSPNKKWVFLSLALLFMSSWPIYWSLQLNIIRSALAVPFFFLMAYSLYFGKNAKSLLWAILAISSHYPTLIYVILFLVFYKVQLEKINRIILILMAIYIFGFIEKFIVSMTQFISNEGIAYYLIYFDHEKTEYSSGTRYDFLAFTIIFMVFAVSNRNKSFNNNAADLIAKIYIISIIPFLLIGFIDYSDRLLVFSWTLIPIIVATTATSYLKFNKILPFLLLSLVGFITAAQILLNNFRV